MKYDLCCLGSALVDITFQIDDDFVKANEERGIAKGGMTLIEKDDQINLIQELMDLGKSPDKACGGSATNSVVAASLFGSSCHMSCIVSDDDNGRFYLEDLSSNGIGHNSELIDSEIPSGQCLVMISDDAERTMCTNLGINSNISISNVDQDVIKNSEYILLEGYLVASPEGYDTFKEAITQAKKYNTKVKECAKHNVKVSYPIDLFKTISADISDKEYKEFFLELGRIYGKEYINETDS